MENKTMAITTSQKNQIINWVNSDEFKPVFNEIVEDCVTSANVYFHLRSMGIDNKNLITAEAIVFGYLLTFKIPFINRPSSKNDAESKKYAEAKMFISSEILKKYGSLFDKIINEQLRINNLQTDF